MTKAQQSEAIASLRETLKPGDTIVTVLRHVSRSGMSRDIDVYFFGRDLNAPRDRWRHCPWNGHSNREPAKECPVCDGSSQVPPMAGDKHWLSYWIARAGVGTWNSKTECVRMGGCGMDMGFALVYDLSHTLFGNGFALRQEWL